jgi:hypothetical protein
VISMANHHEHDDRDNSDNLDQHKGKFLGRLGIGVSSAVIGGGIAMVANMSQVVDLFSRPWSTIVLVIGGVAVVVALLMCVKLWRSPLGGVALVAVGSAAVAGLAFGSATGSAAQTINSPDDESRPDSPPSSRVSVEILDPADGATVPWRKPIRVTAKNLEGSQIPWVYIRGDTPEMFECLGWYGDELAHRGHRFVISAVIVDQVGNKTLSGIGNRGKDAWFVHDQPPVQPVAQSAEVVVRREG